MYRQNPEIDPVIDLSSTRAIRDASADDSGGGEGGASARGHLCASAGSRAHAYICAASNATKPPRSSAVRTSFAAWHLRNWRESLRGIETCLRAQSEKLYHMGIRGGIARATLADANETRDWHIY